MCLSTNRIIFLTVVFIFSTSNCFAVNTRITPSIGLNENFTDNVELQEDELANSDFITVITPEISITNTSRRIQSETNYLLQGITYKNTSGSNIIHTANSETNLEIMKDHFFTGLTLRNGQQNISSNGTTPTPIDNLSSNSDRENVFSYQIEPYWEQRISNYFNLKLGNNFNEIISDSSNSTSNETYLNIVNGSAFSKLQIDFEMFNRVIDNDGGSKIRFSSISNKFTYPFNRSFSAVARVGYDDNDFEDDQDNNGLLWNLGGIWHPSLRTNFEFAFGRRYFGTDLSLEGSYRTRKGEFLIRFSRVPETTRNSLLNQQSFNLLDTFGNLVIDPDTGNPANLNDSVVDQGNEVLVNSNLIARFSYNLKRNNYRLGAIFNEREFQSSDIEEDSMSLEFDWNRRISRKLTSTVSVFYQNRTLLDSSETNNYRVNLSLSRIFAKDLILNAGLRFSLFDSELGSDYSENRAFVGLNKFF